MNAQVSDRKYALIRIRKGDYLLPSNDQRTLWRISTYEEEGSLIECLPDGSERDIRGTFWACWRRPMPSLEARLDVEDWSDWEFWAGPLSTRKDAVAEALRASR